MCVRRISDKEDFYTVDFSPVFAYKYLYHLYIHLNEFIEI